MLSTLKGLFCKMFGGQIHTDILNYNNILAFFTTDGHLPVAYNLLDNVETLKQYLFDNV